jgi:GH25 family lysozyme M1 (1,4-beta-N-acetylmuramidase)
MIFGIDTASVAGNTNVSWTRAKAEGPISFAILRAAWGTSKDSFFQSEWDSLESAGLVAGAYLFLRFKTERFGPAPAPAQQVQTYLDVVDQRLEPQRDLPPIIDVEFPGKGRIETGLTAAQLLDGVRDAWQRLASHFGVAPIIYTSGRVWREDLDDLPAPDLVDSALWLARYPFDKNLPAVRDPVRASELAPQVPSPWADPQTWFIHQYQGDAVQMPGFPTGNVDMNRFHVASKGDDGGHVRWIQRRLGVTENGVFDDATQAAVRALQTSAGLVVDGIVGPRTFVRLAWK